MTDLSKFLTKVTKQTDPDQQRAYALGAFEVMQYLYDISNRIKDPEDLRRVIADEYQRSRGSLHDAVMPPTLLRVDMEKAGNGPTSEEGERDG